MTFTLKKQSWAVNQKGFTLIEMAIVLIIIGLIVGAVVKSKDIISSAKQKKLYTRFAQSWQIAYNTYYDRTGWILGDVSSDTNQIGRDGRCGDASCDNLVNQLKAVGLEPPSLGENGTSCARNYRGAQDRSYTLTVTFKYSAVIGNYLEITGGANGFPVDLGIAWDNIIDGQRGGDTGDFLYDADGTIVANGFSAWPSVIDAPAAASVAILKLQF